MTYIAGDPTALQMPTVAVQISFTNPGQPFVWTDIGDYVNGTIETLTGRNHELQQAQAGTCDIPLDNNDGRFSPWNTASPYWNGGAGLVPNRPVRITAKWLGITYPIWAGYTDKWPVTWPDEVSSQVVLHCVDDLANLNQIYLNTKSYDETVSAETDTYVPLSDPAGTTVPSFVGFPLGVQNVDMVEIDGSPAFGASPPFLISGDTSCDFSQGIGYMSVSRQYKGGGLGPSCLGIDLWWQAAAPPGTGVAVISALLNGSTVVCTVEVDLAGQVKTIFNGLSLTSTSSVCDGEWHHIAVNLSCTSPAASEIWVDDVIEASAVPSGTVTPAVLGPGLWYIGFPFTTPVALMAKFGFYSAASGQAITPAQIAAHYTLGSTANVVQPSGDRIKAVLAAMGWPYSNAGLPNIDTGISEIQASSTNLALSTLLSYIQTIESTEAGAFYSGPDGPGDLVFRDRHYALTNPSSKVSQGTFADTTSGVIFNYLGQKTSPTMDSLDLWNQASVSRINGTVQTWTNQTSANTYGLRQISPRTGLLMTTDTEALACAQWIVSHYSTPLTRVRALTIDSLANGGANFPQMLGRILFDRITVNRQAPDGSSQYVQDALIEQIAHEIAIDSWTTTWALAAPDTQQYLILNDPVLGKLDSDNLLAY